MAWARAVIACRVLGLSRGTLAQSAVAQVHAQLCMYLPLINSVSHALAIAQEDGTVSSSAFEACTNQGTHSQTSPSKMASGGASAPAPGSTTKDTSKKGQDDTKTPVVKAEAGDVKAQASSINSDECRSKGEPGPSSKAVSGSQMPGQGAGPSAASASGQDVQVLVAKVSQSGTCVGTCV
eukprot:48088-Pelagomonas_calceolata.AAC.3